MNRARAPRSLALALAPALTVLAYFGLPTPEVEAANPKRSGGFDEGGYIMLAPGSIALPFRSHDFFDLDPTFGWGFGGGYMFSRGPLFKATVGGVFEHTVLLFDDFEHDNFGGHVLRFMPEARIGLGTNAVWGYGLFGAGIAGTLWSWHRDVPWFDDIDGRRSAPGFNVQVGGGVQGIVWKNLFLGGEVDVDFGYFFHDRDYDWEGDDFNDDDFQVQQVAIEFLIGWYF